jgi:hypothetical protein
MELSDIQAPGALHPKKDLRYTLNRRMGEPKSRYFEKHKKSLAPIGIRTPDRLGYRLITIPTELYRIPLKCPRGTCGRQSDRRVSRFSRVTVPPLLDIRHLIIRRTETWARDKP